MFSEFFWCFLGFMEGRREKAYLDLLAVPALLEPTEAVEVSILAFGDWRVFEAVERVS